MRRWLIVCLFLLLAFLASIYIFIPGKIIVANTVITKCTASGAFRCLEDTVKWKQWWPQSGSEENGDFLYQGLRYRLEGKTFNNLSISVNDGKSTIPSGMNILQIGIDSIALQWSLEIPGSLNPFSRIKHYQEAKAIHRNMRDVLQKLKDFVSNKDNVYGYSINMVSTRDTLLISTKTFLPKKPTQSDIYSLIHTLNQYAEGHGARQNGFPLTNTRKIGKDTFQLMVAIPLDKEIKGEGKIESKRMVPGKFLMTETRGGESTISQAFEQIDLYMHDYKFNDVAIPFEVLETDRMKESDTTKWKTKIYYPIYYL
jgi:hypothetical protein